MTIDDLISSVKELKLRYNLGGNTEIVISKGDDFYKDFTITAWLNNSKIYLDFNVRIKNDETTHEENV